MTVKSAGYDRLGRWVPGHHSPNGYRHPAHYRIPETSGVRKILELVLIARVLLPPGRMVTWRPCCPALGVQARDRNVREVTEAEWKWAEAEMIISG